MYTAMNVQKTHTLKERGFTLIELVVVTAITLTVAGIGSASYLNFNERQVIESAKEDLKTNIIVAKQKAADGEKDPTDCGSLPLAGWCLSPDNTNPQNYRIYGTCGSDTTPPYTTFPSAPATFTLPSNLRLTVKGFNSSTSAWVGNFERVRFDALGTGVTLRDSNFSKMTFCIEGTLPSLGAENKYAVTVTRDGEIIDEGFTSNCFP